MGQFTNKSVRYFFEKVSEIPRQSGDEKIIEQYLISFAQERDLRYEVSRYTSYANDDNCDYLEHTNLIIYKNTAPNLQPIALHCCLDSPDREELNNYENNICVIKRGAYYESYKNCMGALSACGIASILALLDSDTLVNVEAVFTTSSYVDMLGVRDFDTNTITSKSMISFAGVSGDTLFNGSLLCANMLGNFSKEKIFIENSPTIKTFKLNISLEDNLEFFPYSKLLVDILSKITNCYLNKIIINSGIDCVFTTTMLDRDLKNILKLIYTEYRTKNIKLKIKCSRQINQTLILQDGTKIIDLLSKINDFENNESKVNQNIIYFNSDKGMYRLQLKAENREELDNQIKKINDFTQDNNFEAKFEYLYPNFTNEENSAFVEKLKNSYVGINPLQIKKLNVPSEAGIFQSKIKGLEVVAISPTIIMENTNTEKILISSIINNFLWIKKFFNN